MRTLVAVCLLALLGGCLAARRFDGDVVYRMVVKTPEQVQAIRLLAKNVEVDFWRPESADQVAVGMEVDIRVPATQGDYARSFMQRSGLPLQPFIQDVQQAIDAQIDGTRSTAGYNYEKYHDWDEISTWQSSIVAENPDLLSLTQIGSSYQGRPLLLLTLGKKSQTQKKAFFMDCTFHAREWISPAFCQWFVKEGVSTYGSDAVMTNLLDNMDFHILTVFNVDGYAYSWSNDRMWRKTRSPNAGSSCIGTDPNRNFNAGWCTGGASPNPCAETYCGTRFESEVESSSMADFIRSRISSIKAYVSVHSYSQMLLFPYAYTYTLPPNHAELQSLSKKAVSALQGLYNTRYTYGSSATTIYIASGGSDDWAYDVGVKYSFTLELRDTGRYGFLLPESQIKATCEETMLAVKVIAEYVLANAK